MCFSDLAAGIHSGHLSITGHTALTRIYCENNVETPNASNWAVLAYWYIRSGWTRLLWFCGQTYSGRVCVLSAGWGKRGQLIALTGRVIRSDSSRSDWHSTLRLCVTGAFWLYKWTSIPRTIYRPDLARRKRGDRKGGYKRPPVLYNVGVSRFPGLCVFGVCVSRIVEVLQSANACSKLGCTWGVPVSWTAAEGN